MILPPFSYVFELLSVPAPDALGLASLEYGVGADRLFRLRTRVVRHIRSNLIKYVHIEDHNIR